MFGLEYLGLYILIAAVLVWVGNRPRLRWFGRALDRHADRYVKGGRAVEVLAGLGSKRAVPANAGRSVHAATYGLKLVSTLLIVLLMTTLYYQMVGPQEQFVPEDYEAATFIAFGVAGLYYLIYIWRYRLVLEDQMLSIPTLAMSMKHYDLRNLIGVEASGGHTAKLFFGTGRPVEVLRHVADRDSLFARLHAAAQVGSAL